MEKVEGVVYGGRAWAPLYQGVVLSMVASCPLGAFLLASAFAGWSPTSLVIHSHALYSPVSQALELDLPGSQSTL